MKIREAWDQFDGWQKLTVVSLLFTVGPTLFGLITFAGRMADDIPQGLVYYVNPIKTPIFRAAEAPDVEVRYRGERITGDITTVQVALWNNGSTPVRRSDVLEDIRITLGPEATILDATLREASRAATRSEVTTLNNSDGSQNAVVSWQILEQQDAVLLQLTYVGPTNTQIELEGVVVGQASIPRLDPFFARTARAVIQPRATVVLSAVYIISGLALFGLVLSTFRPWGTLGLEDYVVVIMMCGMGIAAVLYGVQTIRTVLATPDVHFWSTLPQ